MTKELRRHFKRLLSHNDATEILGQYDIVLSHLSIVAQYTRSRDGALGSNPGGCEISRTFPERLRSPPILLYNGYRVSPGGKGGRGVAFTTYLHLVPRPTERNRPIPLFSLRAFATYNRVKPYFTQFTLQPLSRKLKFQPAWRRD